MMNFNLKAALKVLSNQCKGFQICHLNARSLNRHKLDYLYYICAASLLNVIYVTETCFKADVNDSLLSLNY